MVHNLNSKNLHINGLFFLLQNPKNPIFAVFLELSQKSGPVDPHSIKGEGDFSKMGVMGGWGMGNFY